MIYYKPYIVESKVPECIKLARKEKAVEYLESIKRRIIVAIDKEDFLKFANKEIMKDVRRQYAEEVKAFKTLQTMGELDDVLTKKMEKSQRLLEEAKATHLRQFVEFTEVDK